MDVVTYIASLEVEPRGIECVRFGKARHAHSEMAEFVHWCRTWNLLLASGLTLRVADDVPGWNLCELLVDRCFSVGFAHVSLLVTLMTVRVHT